MKGLTGPGKFGRDTLRSDRKISESFERKSSANSWITYAAQIPYFSASREDRDGSFFGLSSPQEVIARVDKRHARGEKVLFLDLFGQGHYGFEAGEDATIACTLLKPEETVFAARSVPEESLRGNFLKRPGLEFIDGDIFDIKHWKGVLAAIDRRLQDGHVLDTVFLRPLGGMNVYAKNDSAQLYMYDPMLRDIYERLATDGRVFLELIALHDLNPDVLNVLKEIFLDESSPKIPNVAFRQNRDRPTFMLEKQAHAPETLPSVPVLRRRYPRVNAAIRAVSHLPAGGI